MGIYWKRLRILYCLQELLTNNRLNREGPGTFHGEGLVLPGNNGLGVEVTVGPALDALRNKATGGGHLLLVRSLKVLLVKMLF